MCPSLNLQLFVFWQVLDFPGPYASLLGRIRAEAIDVPNAIDRNMMLKHSIHVKGLLAAE